jgi:NADH dehydrogenase FAD-containing subunit
MVLVFGTEIMDAAQLDNVHYLALLLAGFAIYGAGALSLDGLIGTRLRRRFPQLDGRPAFDLDGLPRVVLVGAGFGGLACVKALRDTPVEITLIDRHNYHLFQPLLYQVATTALAPGDIAELARFGMEKEFRHLDPANARVILVQSGPRILPVFPEKLSARAEASLRRLGVEVLTDSRVEAIDAEGVKVSGTPIIARTVFWAAGVVASPAGKWLGAACDRSGRVEVGPDLSVPDLPEVFVVGDTAASNAWNGKPVPGLGPAAKQAGTYAAGVIRAGVEGRDAPTPFKYVHLGSLATIGRKAAVADFGIMRLSGTLAWWLWGLVHVYFLAGMRNRISVMLDWAWAYVTFRSSTRLITAEALSSTGPETHHED